MKEVKDLTKIKFDEYGNSPSYLVFPKDFPEDKKEYFRHLAEQRAMEQTQICVVYRPNCGCPVEDLVVLDRFPMSKKIHSKCRECGKGILTEISDPIIFTSKLQGDFTLEELASSYFTESRQKIFLEKYKNSFLNMRKK